MPISKAKPEHPSLDYELLRQEGIRHIENLATEIWTDFNVHDPGITLLEVLSYAITDLGYRTRRIPMGDLLAGSVADKPFFLPTEVLPAGPVTELDYRKLLIDIDGVKNAWLARQEDATLYFKRDSESGGPVSMAFNVLNEKVVHFKEFIKEEPNIKAFIAQLFPTKEADETGAHILLCKDWATNGLSLAEWEEINDKMEPPPAGKPSKPDQLIIAKALLCEYGYFPLEITPKTDTSIRLDGLVKIYIDLDDELDPDNKSDMRRVSNKVMDRLYAQRGLGQDYVVPVEPIGRTPVAVCLHIEVEDKPNEVEIAAEALWQIERHLSPNLRFYTFKQMRAKGFRTEEIYNGPLLEHGFLDDSEVLAAAPKTSFQHSDLTNAATVLNVKTVHDLKVKVFPDAEFGIKTSYTIPKGYRPQFDLHNSVIYVTRNGVPREVKHFELAEPLRRRRILAENHEDIGGLSLPPGTKRDDLTTYKSVQYDLPAIYGVGSNILAAHTQVDNQAAGQQLRAYLAFFDQILAAYLQQLGLLRTLFSTNQTILTGADGKSILNQTYTTADLANIPGLSSLLDDKKTFKAESPAIQRDRLNRVLTHLLARFGETFSDYAVSLLRPDEGPEDDPFYRDFTTYLQGKAAYLRELPGLRTNLGRGYNYRNPKVWNTENVAGIKKHIHLKLALKGSWHTQSLIPQPVYRLDVVQVRSKTGTLQHQVILKVMAEQLAAVTNRPLSELDIPLGGIPMRSIPINSLKVAQDKRDNLYTQTWNKAYYSVKPHPKEPNKFAVLFSPNNIKELYSSPLNKQEADKLLEYMLDLVTFIPNGELEGFHIVEHILLRPNDPKDTELLKLSPGCQPETAPVDPYSWWLTVVLPNWTVKFGDKRFQEQFEQAFREEMPAHLAVRFCWVDKETMRTFEELYQAWMIAKALCTPDDCKVTEEAKKLTEWMNNTPCSCTCNQTDWLISPCKNSDC